MKKVRFLAVILAVLMMIPFGALVGCKKSGDDNPDTSASDSATKPEIKTDPIVTEPIDNDGSKDGYLMYFSFDAAKRGDLRTDLKPYDTYFKVADKAGAKYIVDSEGGIDGKGALIIQRERANSDPYVELDALAVAGLSATHVVEFDIKVSKGLLNDNFEIYSRKEAGGASSQIFVKIDAEAVKDGGGTVLYEVGANDKWVHIAIAVNDEERYYDVYVNGGKMTDKTAFSTTTYPKYSEQPLSTYRLGLEAGDGVDSYAYIDNFCIADGTEPKVRDTSKDNAIYKDNFTQALNAFAPNKDSVMAFVEAHDTLGTLKQSAYGEGNLMSGSLGLAKVNRKTNTVTDLLFDYGVEKGLYHFGGAFGGRAFVNGENYVSFDESHEYKFTAKIDGAVIEGTYKVTETDKPEAVLTWTENATEKHAYCVLDSHKFGNDDPETKEAVEGYITEGVIKYYADAAHKDSKGDYTLFGYTMPFSGTTYIIDTEACNVKFTVDEFAKTASIAMTAGNVVMNDDKATIAYADGKLTITSGEVKAEFVYDAENDKFKYGENVLVKYVADVDKVTEDETLVLKWKDYVASGASQLNFKLNMDGVNPAELTRIKFDYYIPEDGVNYQYLIYIDTGTSAEGWSYYSSVIKQSSPGWYTFEKVISSMGNSRRADMSRFAGTVVFTAAGWSNGPVGKKGIADGYSFCVANLEFPVDRSIQVKGPDAEHTDCKHVDASGKSTFVPTDTVIAPTCTQVGYTELRCSVCGATKVDQSKPIIAPSGHKNLEETVHTVLPTCTEDGYTYRKCLDCGELVIIDVLKATGHDYVQMVDASKGTLLTICRICGESSEVPVEDRLLTGVEKKEKLGLGKTDVFLADENIGFSMGSKTTSPTGGQGCLFAVMKNTILEQVHVAGRNAFEFSRYAAIDGFVDWHPTDRFGARDHVLEVDVMLGKKSNNKYPIIRSFYKDRHVTKTDATIFEINDMGTLKVSGTTFEYQLSEFEFTNLAIVISPATGKVNWYINGVHVIEAPFSGASNFTGCDCRFGFQSNDGTVDGASYYVDGFMMYEGSIPACIVADSKGAHKGDIPVDDAKGNAFVGADVDAEALNVALKPFVFTSQYVLDMSIKADGALTDGALLTGKKLDKYGFDVEQAILTVKGGYIYLYDVAIVKVDDIKNGAKITIAFDDLKGLVTAYVNGTAVPGGTIECTADSTFKDSGSVIRSYTFGGGLGKYNVSGFNMYTGTDIK